MFYQELKLFYKLYQNYLSASNLFNVEALKEIYSKDTKEGESSIELNDLINKHFLFTNKDKLNDLKAKFTELYDIHNFMFINRWGVYECKVCKESFQSESQFNFHEQTENHLENTKKVSQMGNSFSFEMKFKTDLEFMDVVKKYKVFRPVIFLSIMEHNSNALVWRDTGAKIIYIGFKERENNIDENNKDELSYKSCNNGFDYDLLKKSTLKYKNNIIKIGSFTAASNITGEKLNVDLISIIMHEVSGLAFFDYATAAPYLKADMNNLIPDNFEDTDTPSHYSLNKLNETQKKLCYKDAIFFSPHKFIGGPNTSGVLIIKQNIVRTLLKPADTGGGVVLFVTQSSVR